MLPVAGQAELETRDGGRAVRDRWLPGRVQLGIPHQATVRRYRGDPDMRSIQVHIPRDTVDSVVARLGGDIPDFEAMAASVATGDPLLEETVRIRWHGTYSARRGMRWFLQRYLRRTPASRHGAST